MTPFETYSQSARLHLVVAERALSNLHDAAMRDPDVLEHVRWHVQPQLGKTELRGLPSGLFDIAKLKRNVHALNEDLARLKEQIPDEEASTSPVAEDESGAPTAAE